MAGSLMALDRDVLAGRRFTLAASYHHARRAPVTPLVASEIMNACQETPILFRQDGERWAAVGVIDPGALRTPLVGDDGRWLGEYVPLVLRLHPFRWQDEGDAFGIDPEGLSMQPEHGHAFLDRGGRLSARFRKVLDTLRLARDGQLALASLATRLAERGLLTPVSLAMRLPASAAAIASLFTVDALKLSGLPRADLSALVDGAPSTLDLAVAALYSARRLQGALDLRRPEELEDMIASRLADMVAAAKGGAAPAAPASTPAPGAVAYAIDPSVSLDFSGLAG